MALKVGVFGAGAVGGYLGLRLAAAGADVVLYGRQWLGERAPQLVAVDLAGVEYRAAEFGVRFGGGGSRGEAPFSAMAQTEGAGSSAQRPGRLWVTDDPQALAVADICLVTVKSAQTEEAARILSRVLPPSALVLSFQNGLYNARALRGGLRAQAVATGIVSFNVVVEEGARFRQATSGPLVVGRLLGSGQGMLERVEGLFRRSGLLFDLHHDIGNLQVGKLLVNLNNGVCAATGLTIRGSVLSRAARRCFAACIREGMMAFEARGFRPAKVLALPPRALAKALLLPDPIFLRMASSLLQIDPRATSSTLQDLQRGKKTEIDELNGEVVSQARLAGQAAPANEVVWSEVQRLERAALAGDPLNFLSAEALYERIRSAV